MGNENKEPQEFHGNMRTVVVYSHFSYYILRVPCFRVPIGALHF